MAHQQFGAFRYDHDGSLRWSRMRKLFALVFAVTAVAGAAGLVARGVAWPMALFMALLVGIVWLMTFPARRICLGNRYAVVGNTIVYFRNVRRLVLQPGRDLSLHGDGGCLLTIELERFPTNARKTEKVRRNKQAKFDKVVDKVIERVRRESPGAEIQGMVPSARTSGKAAR